jgi:DNA-binding NarL/FixJ family response regulator
MSQEEQPYRIIIVDDVRAERVAVKAAIRRVAPNSIFTEADSLDAAKRVLRDAEEPFDLAVIDLRLWEDAEGLQLVDAIQQVLGRYSQTRVIVLTALQDYRLVREAYRMGTSSFISKLEDNSTQILQEEVKNLLEQKGLRGTLRRQFEAQRIAESAFAQHRDEWTSTYGGKIVLVSGETVIAAHSNAIDAWQDLAGRAESERVSIGVVKVPLARDQHGVC